MSETTDHGRRLYTQGVEIQKDAQVFCASRGHSVLNAAGETIPCVCNQEIWIYDWPNVGNKLTLAEVKAMLENINHE